MNFMIIGLGNIGKRHLESLLKIKCKSNIYLIDPKFKKGNQNLLGSDFKSLNSKIYTYSDLNIWFKKKIILDLCIIATNSDIRFHLLNKIISLAKVKNIILEKFLFNKVSDYAKALKLYHNNQVPIYVNQWMCQSLVMRNILSRFKNDKVDIDVTGIEWGMACNIIHFIDLIRFFDLNELRSISVSNHNLSKNIRRSKRVGFYEIYGDISINYGQHKLFVSCREDNHDVGSAPFGIDVKIKSRNYPSKITNLNLKSGWVKGEEIIDNRTSQFSNQIELISDMTKEIVEKILINKKIYLPNMKVSINQHLAISKLFANHLAKTIHTDEDFCLVT